MLLWCVTLGASHKKLENTCTLLTCLFNPYHALYRDATATLLKSATVSAPSLSLSDDFTRVKDSKPKRYFQHVVLCALKKLQYHCSLWLSCSCKSSKTNQDCILTNPSYFCGSWTQSFCFKSLKRNRSMPIAHVLAGQSLKSGSLFSAFGFCKFPRNWLRRGSNCTSLRCGGTSALWNDSWSLALMSGKPLNWVLAKHSAWLLFGLCTCSIAVGTSTLLGPPALAEPLKERPNEDTGSCEGPAVTALATSHGKKVLTNYSVIGIPGDGRCLFRAVAHGAHVRSGNGVPSESVQRESADVLRGKVVDELIKRRAETEWFIEGDFDSYTRRMRQTHVWGGEPELLMASHVLRMPITVYMFEQRSKGLISIAEYGQEYTKENHVPIRVLYHGFGHYDALQLPGHENQSC